jgi:hypothetical protein
MDGKGRKVEKEPIREEVIEKVAQHTWELVDQRST